MTKIAIIIGSVRPNRFGPQVAEWFFERALKSGGAEFELVDIADYHLPMLDEPVPSGNTHKHTQKWQAKMAEFDGFVLVTPEYNHSFPASLKNALDYTNDELFFKPVSYVSYGSIGGIRAVEQLRQIAATFRQYDLRSQVVIIGQANPEKENTTFIPDEKHEKSAQALIKEITFWSRELIALRQKMN